MTSMHKPLRNLLIALAVLAGLVFAAAFVMVFLGDPQFPPMPEPSPEEMAEFAARFEQPYPAERRTFTLRDGTVLSSLDFPAQSGTTVVLVHGVLSSSFLMNRAAGLLREAASAEVLAVDLRGHGASGGVPGDVDYIGQHEDDLAELIAQLRASKPGERLILAGHSMGGGISLRYAMKADAPPVDGYLLYAPHLGPGSPTTPTEFSEAAGAFVQIHVPRILGLALFNSVGITAFNGLRTLFFNLPEQMPLRSYSYRAMVGMHPDDHAAALLAMHQPLLVLAGSADEAFRGDRYEAAIRPYSKGEVVLLDGANHDGVLHDPRSRSAIRRWVATLGPSRSRS